MALSTCDATNALSVCTASPAAARLLDPGDTTGAIVNGCASDRFLQNKIMKHGTGECGQESWGQHASGAD